MLDEYREFAALFHKRHLGSMSLVETGELAHPDRQLSEQEKQTLAELPTAKSWNLFDKALVELDQYGNRKAVAEVLDQLVQDYPNTYYADEARELLPHLRRMIAEDAGFETPADFAQLSLEQRIEFHIHNLRNVRASQFTQPGTCELWFEGSTDPRDEAYNAAAALVEIGEPAVKRLAELSGDRRPIRGIGYWRDFVPRRHVLRYADAAEQIIRQMRQKP